MSMEINHSEGDFRLPSEIRHVSESNSFATFDAEYRAGTRLAERVLFTEDMGLMDFLRNALDFLFGCIAVEDLAELMSAMGHSSVREYIRKMDVDLKKLVLAAKVYKSETGFSPRLPTRREKAISGATSEQERFEIAVTREHYGEQNDPDEEGHVPDWEMMEKLGETDLKYDQYWWWRKNVTMKPFIKQGKMLSGIRLSFDKNLDKFTTLNDFRIGEDFMLSTPVVKRFRELWENEPSRLGWLRHKKLWAATMEIRVKADPRTGKAYKEPKVAHLWCYVSKSTMDNEDARKAIGRLALSQRRKVKAWTPPANESWWKKLADESTLFRREAGLEDVDDTIVKDNGEVWLKPGPRGNNNHLGLDPNWDECQGHACFLSLRKMLLNSNGEF